MGHIGSTQVDVAALLAAAHRYDTAALLIDNAAHRCEKTLAFGAGCAGRDYRSCGDEVRRAVVGSVGRLRSWAAANRDIAAGLRSTAREYARVDAGAAQRLG